MSSTAKTLKKVASAVPTPKPKSRPATFTFEIVFAEGSRRVVPADLEKAAHAAAATLRTSLESRTPKYQIGSLSVVYEYLYVQARKRFKA